MDQWMQKLAVAVVLLTAGVAFYAKEEGVVCWCPVHFTGSMVHYTDTVCANEHTNQTRLDTTRPAKILAGSAFPEQGRSLPVKLLTKNTALLKYLAGELLLAAGLYFLIKCITASSSLDVLYPDSLLRCHRKIPAYILVQVVGGFLWACFAVLTHNSYAHLDPADEPFMCNFTIHVLGALNAYSVQCVEEGTEEMSTAIMANIGFCSVVAVSKLIHLVSLFAVQPLFRAKKLISKMAAADNEIHNGVGVGFCLSDFYFTLLVHGSKVTSMLSLKGEQDGNEPK